MDNFMEYNEFKYTVSPRPQSTWSWPLTVVKLTCIKVHRKIIRHPFDNKPTKSSTPFPDQTIVHYSGLLSLEEPYDAIVEEIGEHPYGTMDTIISKPTTTTTSDEYSLSYARISHIMDIFGLPYYICLTILGDIEEFIKSTPSTKRGGIEVNIWKIENKVVKIEGVFMERCGIDSNGSKEMSDSDGCVICMENYTYGELVSNRLPCEHHFHAACLLKWLECNRRCPLCRVSMADYYMNGNGP